MSSLTEKIRVYPGFNAYYYSFYFEGLRSTFKEKSIIYSTNGFLKFGHHCLPFIIEGNQEKRVYISAGDGPGLNEEGLKWCDIYAKVNLDPNTIPQDYASKLMAIGPSFAIRIWGPPFALWHFLKTFLAGRSFIDNPREHFANHWRQFKYRLPEQSYQPGTVSSNYIFFASSLWKNEAETNNYRATFIKVCRSLPSIQFEGGFVPRKDILGFEGLMLNRAKYSLVEYLQKIKASTVVFNTPAVQKCHGWKLGEYLALGKAIISTPLMRQLPAPLVHGEHIHYVDGSQEAIEAAICCICYNNSYRKTLERGARQYYLEYLQPSRVIKRILR